MSAEPRKKRGLLDPSIVIFVSRIDPESLPLSFAISTVTIAELLDEILDVVAVPRP